MIPLIAQAGTVLSSLIDYAKTVRGQRNILLIALIAVILMWRGCGSSDADITIYKQQVNLDALKDSVRTYRNKNDELVFEKRSLITDMSDLKRLNGELYEEVKNLRDNPITITKFTTKIVSDTVWLQPVIDWSGVTFNEDSTVKIVPFTWAYDTTYDAGNSRTISGRYVVQIDTGMNVTSDNFTIDLDSIRMSFVTGITETDSFPEIFIKSNHPGFAATQIEGTLFDPRKSETIKRFFPPKKWGVGPYVGYGVYFDPQRMQVGHGVTAGLSVQFDVIQWRKWKRNR